SPIHFRMLQKAFSYSGYHVEVLDNDNRDAIDVGLKYVNNDACYPSLIVVGQIMSAVLSGRYDTHKLAIFITQTGGGCRATNYIGFIRRALRRAGLDYIPVISLSATGLEKNPGLKYTPRLLMRALQALIYGDVLMRVLYRMRPYEKEPGSANALYEQWNEKLCNDLKRPTLMRFKKNCRAIVKDFDALPIDETLKKPRVGIVGEILVKFQPTANNHLVELLEQEGAEAVCPDLIDFFLYTCYDGEVKSRLFGKSKKEARYNRLAINLIEHFRKAAQEALAKSKHFERANYIDDMQKLSAPIVSEANMTGEGWFLTAEMIELIESGTPNIVCAQPFACLPNHIVGKGVIKSLRSRFPDSNIVAVDYDPGASEVNQLNRIKLMLSVAQKKALEGIGTR
ncbi:MAG: 2-hydroxyacyl-CoA dehydratase, partial [Lachnospiraceae bacterium]|nr:2-hydroxyacyl-CoA dehydratase [Lachnospiraceae bacterium]